METMDLSSLMLGPPTDVAGFEKELMAMAGQMTGATMTAADARDIEELIADALKRRCSCNNGRKAAMHMHLRLKTGAKAEPVEMTRRELAELADLVTAKSATNAIVQRLANFYVRIAMLRARIEAILRSSSADPAANPANPANPDVQGNGKYENQLLAAHAKNEDSLREKRDQNQRELDRIMRALFLGDDIHPALTEDDLPALETQVEHIAERGCIVQELRRVKIAEALLEQRRLDALLSQLRMHPIR
jgi:hypothetical protein